MNTHQIDYRIIGEEMQCVEIELDPLETVIAEAGSLMMMDGSIQMQTVFGDGSKGDQSFMGKMFSAGKRVLTGESLFMTAYTNNGTSKDHVTFAAPYPGKVIALDIAELGGKVICQKDAFLCAAQGTSIGIEFQKRIGVGLFGEKGLSCKRSKVMGWRLFTQEAQSLRENYNLVSFLKLIRDALWPLQKTFNTISNL